MKDYLNFRFQQPYQQVMYNCSMLLEHKRWHINEFIDVLPSLEARDLTAFFPRILSRVFFECFIAGMGPQRNIQVLLRGFGSWFALLVIFYDSRKVILRLITWVTISFWGSFFRKCLNQSHILREIFAGNLTSNEAEGLVEQIENTLSEGPLVKARPPFPSQHTEQRIVKLGPGADWYFPIAGTNSQDDNSALQTYFQVFIVTPMLYCSLTSIRDMLYGK